MLASQQSFSTSLDSREFWKIAAIAEVTVSVDSCRTLAGISSGPHALWGRIFFSSCSTPLTDMVMEGISGCGLGANSGMHSVFLAVNIMIVVIQYFSLLHCISKGKTIRDIYEPWSFGIPPLTYLVHLHLIQHQNLHIGKVVRWISSTFFHLF